MRALAAFAVGGIIASGLVLGSSSTPGGGGIVPSTDASAGVAGGGGGGGGGGGTGNARWMEISGAKLGNGTVSNLPGVFWSDPVCRNAVRYYALVPNVVSDGNARSDRWTYSLFRSANLSGVDFRYGSDVAHQIAGNVGWNYQQAASYMWGKNLICLDNPDRFSHNEWRYEMRQTGAGSDALNFSGVHSYITTVTPQPLQDGKGGTVTGPSNRKVTPSSSVQVTNFGKVWDDFNRARNQPGANTQNLVASFKKRFEDARAQDAANTASRDQLTLTREQQDALADGGILNVKESTRSVSATASTNSSSWQVWRCGWDYYTRSGWRGTGCERVGGTINPDAVPYAGKGYARWDSQHHRNLYNSANPWGATSWTAYSTSSSAPETTPKDTGFWQILSVHCNAQGIVDLRREMKDDLVLISGDGALGNTFHNVSGVMRTKFYSKQPSVLPLGDVNAPLDSQKATAYVSFFDKECPYECTPSRLPETGASDANGAVDNIRKEGFEKTVKGFYGSKFGQDELNSSYSEIFRDNSPRTIRPDVWYPRSQNGVSYNGEEPKSTYISRWQGGTPALATYDVAGKNANEPFGKKISGDFTVSANILQEPVVAGKTRVEKKEVLFSPTAIPGSKITKTTANQKNFDTGAFDSSFRNATQVQVPGLVRELEVQSSWASKENLPQVLQIAWEYSPTVTSIVPTKVGFARNSADLQIGNYEARTSQVDGRCWGEFGNDFPKTTLTTKNDLAANTGTGTTPNFRDAGNGQVTNPRSLVINFVRGTSE